MQSRTCAQALAAVVLAFTFSYSCGNEASVALATARSTRANSRPDIRIHCKGEINSIAFSPNGRTVVAAVELHKRELSNLTQVNFYDSHSGRLQQKFTVPGLVFDLEYAPDGKSVLFNFLQYRDNVAENSLQIWDFATRRRRKIFETADESLIAPSGKVMATAGNQIRLFSAHNWKSLSLFPMPFKGEPFGAAFSPDSRLLAMLHASVDGLSTDLHVVEVRTGKVMATWGGDDRSQDMLGPPFAFLDAAPFARRDRATSMIFRGNLVRFRWKGRKWVVSESKSLLPDNHGVVEALAVGKRNLVLINDSKGRRILWDCDRRRTLRTWTDKAHLTQDAAFSRDQNLVVLVDGRDLLISSLTPRP